jgi:hypothetical protein
LAWIILECGGLTPLWMVFFERRTQRGKRKENPDQSGVKPSHSTLVKTIAKWMRGHLC